MDLYNGNLQNLSPTPQINNLLCLMLHYQRDMLLPHGEQFPLTPNPTSKMLNLREKQFQKIIIIWPMEI